MTKYEQSVREIADFVNAYAKDNPGEIFKSGELTRLLKENGIEPDVMFLPSDYCYNRTNAGIKDFRNTIHVFEYVKRGVYRLLGEHFSYTGPVITKPSGQPFNYVVGEWSDGLLTMIDKEEDWIKEEDYSESLSEQKRFVTQKRLGDKNNVWLIKDTENDTLFVKKVLKNGDVSIYKRLMEESIYGLPKVLDVEVMADGSICTKEEYVEGVNLKELSEQSELSETQVSAIALQICRILDSLHSTVPTLIHRDIKPSNIMLCDDGKVFLIDFNAVKEVKENTSEDTQFAATPYFAAPEQVWYGGRSSNVTTDIYGLGATLNYLLTGTYVNRQTAFGEWGDIIKKCTQMNCDDRYQSANDLAMDILKLMTM